MIPLSTTAASAAQTAISVIKAALDSRLSHCVILIVLAVIADKLLNRRILRAVSRKMQSKNEDNAGRYKTLFSVLSKIVTAVIAFVVILWIVQILFNVSPASIIAATGIAGAALGLGAQSLVKDSINGFFILTEDQFGVGDYVTIDNFQGKIHSVSLRMTCVENMEGDRMFIPNSAITKVVNHSKDNHNVVLDIPVSYDADISLTLSQLEEITEELPARFGYITDKPRVLGVNMLDSSAINIRILIPCTPPEQYQCRRDALRTIGARMAECGIEIPYAHVTVIHKEASSE